MANIDTKLSSFALWISTMPLHRGSEHPSVGDTKFAALFFGLDDHPDIRHIEILAKVLSNDVTCVARGSDPFGDTAFGKIALELPLAICSSRRSYEHSRLG
jgi:hypothetical protein